MKKENLLLVFNVLNAVCLVLKKEVGAIDEKNLNGFGLTKNTDEIGSADSFDKIESEYFQREPNLSHKQKDFALGVLDYWRSNGYISQSQRSSLYSTLGIRQ